MKKHKLKNYLKLGIFLFGVSVFLNNCENEIIEESILVEENGSNPYFKTGKLQDFKLLNNYAKELELKSKTQSTVFNRTTIEDGNGFTIVEDEDVFVYTGTTSTSYTLVIQKDNQPENTFSNLVVQFNDDSPTKAFILNYTPTDGYLEARSMDDQTPFEGTANYEPLDYDGSLNGLNERAGCYTVSITYCNNDGAGGTGETHAAGSNCSSSDHMWTQTYTFCPNEEQDNSIDPPTGPSGGGGSNSTGDPDPSDDNPPEDNEDCLLDSDGNCLNDAVTDPNPSSTLTRKTTDEKNCEELQKLFATPNYPIAPPALSPKAAIANLKSLISTNVDPNNDQERGYNLLHNSSLNASASWVNNTSSRSVRYRFSLNNYGGCHLHPNDGKGHPFFSPEDILNLWRFYSTYNNGTAVDPSLFVHVLVSTKGVYAIKIDNPSIFGQLAAIYLDYKDANQDGTDEVEEFSRPLENAYKRFIDYASGYPTGSDTDYQRAFLKFMNNFDGNGTKIGISLYKADTNLTSWSKLTLNETTNIITPTPCD